MIRSAEAQQQCHSQLHYCTLLLYVCVDAMWVPQGGANADAEQGVQLLAEEIMQYWTTHQQQQQQQQQPPQDAASSSSANRLTVVVPAGTGTTAAFLSRHLKRLCAAANSSGNSSGSSDSTADIAVIAVPCVGDAPYLHRQMLRVLADTSNSSSSSSSSSNSSGSSTSSTSSSSSSSSSRKSASTTAAAEAELPVVLEGSFKQQFGEPRAALLDVWRELQDADLFVDLLYGVRAWEVLFEQWSRQELLQEDSTLMYVHCGGLEGVSSQLTRYKHKKLIDSKLLQ
jgi:1-aminocyclopropane-1-carboxylate deaminase